MAFRYWFGAMLVAVGLGLLADQFYPGLQIGYWLGRVWPLAIVVLGLIVLLTRTSTLLGGIILTVIGILLQFAVLGWLLESTWNLLWPAFLILLGVLVLVRFGRTGGATADSADVINSFAAFYGSDIRPQSANFRGGSATVVFGGIQIDLRNVTPAREGAALELTAAFGGMTVIVPREWKVALTGLPLFGGYSNKTMPAAAAGAPVLTIRCLAMFGGIEVKN
jgi:predicted membrane protein